MEHLVRLSPVWLVALMACITAPEAPPDVRKSGLGEPATGLAATPGASLIEPGRIADRLLVWIRQESGAPGLSSAVVIDSGFEDGVDGQLVWSGESGWADVAAQRPVAPDAQFRLASVSKLFTATAAVVLAEEGRLDLDADVRTWVPEWPVSDGAIITPRLLAAHAAGINHYASLSDSDYIEGHHYDDVFDTLRFFDFAPLLFEPGTGYSYSSFGYVLLTAVLERASGQALDTLFASRFFDPLSLRELAIEDVRALPDRAVTLYEIQSDGVPLQIDPIDQSHAAGATGMRGTARDVARFGAAFLSGEIVPIAVRDRALAPLMLTAGESAGEERFDVGVGWRIGLDWDDRPVAHHAGVTPGTRSILLGYPQAGAAVALLSNARWTSRIETTAELLAAPFLENEPLTTDDCPVGAWTFTGTVRGESDHGHIAVEFDRDLCVGELTSEGALAARFRADGPSRTRPFPLVLIARRGADRVFALAFPWGLARLRIEPRDAGLKIEGDIVGWPVALEAS